MNIRNVEVAGPGADGKTERYSVVVYRRDMATEGNQNAFNIENEKRIEVSRSLSDSPFEGVY